jgi:hypothetical protein
MNRKYFQIIKKLDDSKFKPLPSKGSMQDKALQLEKNCWSMFTNWNKPWLLRMYAKILGIKQDCQHPSKFCVSDFAWTEQVEEAFKNHPYHKRFLENNKKNFSISLFLLDMLPATYVTHVKDKTEIKPNNPWPRTVSSPVKTVPMQQRPSHGKPFPPEVLPSLPVPFDFGSGMTKGQLCKLLETDAVLYLKDSKESLRRNTHEFSFRGTYNHKFAMAVLIDYINFVARGQGLDLGLEEKHILNP